MVSRVRPHLAKSGKYMGFAAIEDIQGAIELAIFPGTWEKYRTLVQVDEVIIASGRVDSESKEPKVLVDTIRTVRERTLSVRPLATKLNLRQRLKMPGLKILLCTSLPEPPEMVWEDEEDIEDWEDDLQEEEANESH